TPSVPKRLEQLSLFTVNLRKRYGSSVDLSVRKNAKLQLLDFLTVTHDRYRAKKLIFNANLRRNGNG
ncbi:hypothetical protein, partial [Paenibacillus oryzae]|uniref:hypothetical protein n=1 Tax=Paenibacillus oryzae TaxID=1844972 RepID=UPI001B80DBA2